MGRGHQGAALAVAYGQAGDAALSVAACAGVRPEAHLACRRGTAAAGAVPVLVRRLTVNSWNFEAFWAVDWVVRDDFVVNLGQRYFVTPIGTNKTPIFETWGLTGINQGRSETTLRLTYQF
jgi:hypothetical protein